MNEKKRNNLSKLFYKDYYKDVTFQYALEENGKASKENIEIIEKNNKALLSASLPDDLPENPIEYESFSMKVSYPGLVTGIGLIHDSKKLTGAFNLGMHFDYTYGMPIIYGSSVKGVLHNYFKEFYKGDIDKCKLLSDIFEGEGKSIYKRDIFFDAVITKADSKGRILESDSITPHNISPLLNPIPITFLKIASGCTIEFRFKLVDSQVDGCIFAKQEKKELFQEIIKTVGVGAKTNVGYGQFE